MKKLLFVLLLFTIVCTNTDRIVCSQKEVHVNASALVDLMEAVQDPQEVEKHNLIQKLLACKADVSADGAGMTPLHWAVEKPYSMETLHHLIAAGAQIYGGAVDIACMRGAVEKAQLLLSQYDDDALRTILLRDDALLSLLKNTEKNLLPVLDATVGRLLRARPSLAGCKNETTPLHVAISKRCSKKMVELLLDTKADVGIQDHNGVTPIDLACESGDTAMLVLLLSRLQKDGSALVKPNALASIVAHADNLDLLVQHNIVASLLHLKADINAVYTDKKTALYWAMDKQFCEPLVRSLLGAKAAVGGYIPSDSKNLAVCDNHCKCLQDMQWSTPLDAACNCGSLEKIQSLLLTARQEMQSHKSQHRVLHCNALGNLLRGMADVSVLEDGVIVNQLIELRADVNPGFGWHRSPLHSVMGSKFSMDKRFNEKLALLFIEKKADVTGKSDTTEPNVLGMACKAGSINVLLALLSKMGV